MSSAKRFLGKLVIVLLLGFCFINPTAAATFEVDITADTVDATPGNGTCADTDGNCSLRAAIMEANALTGADIINLLARTYTLSLESVDNNYDDDAKSGDLDITDPVTINGAGAETTIISGGWIEASTETDRIFHILASVTNGENTTINDLTIQNGTRLGDGCTEPVDVSGLSGGGIYNAADGTVINRCEIINNSSDASGGGVSNVAQLTMNNCKVDDNYATDGSGGGINNINGCTLDMTGCTVSGNTTGNSGGGIKNGGSWENSTDPASLTMEDCTVSGNTTGNSGGGIKNGGSWENSTDPASLTMEDCTVSGNTAPYFSGGGIRNKDGALIIENTTVNGNSSGGSSDFYGGGGGIDHKSENRDAHLTIRGCTVSNNTSRSSGGGIRNTSFDGSFPCTLDLINTTVSGNHSDVCTGGVHTNANATNHLLFCTVAHNSTTDGDYSGINDCGNVTIENTIIAYNSGTDHCLEDITAYGMNIIYDDGCSYDTEGNSIENVDSTNPFLELLANNGGSTWTHALQDGSPALDVICPEEKATIRESTGESSITAEDYSQDQRLVPRPQGTCSDIGAFEAISGVFDTEYDDGDDVDSTTEMLAPNSGDGNGDGVLDALQSGVTSLLGSDGNYVTVELIEGPVGCGQLDEVKACSEASQSDDDLDYDYPFGLVAFEIHCEWAKVRVYFHGATESITGPYRKYGPVPETFDTPEWYDLADNPNANVTFGMAVVGGANVYYAEFTLYDNQLGDDTSNDNIIFDQGGPGVPGDAIPTLNEWGTIIFMLLIIISGIYYRRKELN